MMPPQAVFRLVDGTQEAPITNSHSRPEFWLDNTSSQVCRVYPLEHDRFQVIHPTRGNTTLRGELFRQLYSPVGVPVAG